MPTRPTARLGDEELSQIVEQRLCRLEVSSVKSFGKPAIDGRYEISLRIPVMAIGYSSRRRSPIPVIAIMAGRQEQGRP